MHPAPTGCAPCFVSSRADERECSAAPSAGPRVHRPLPAAPARSALGAMTSDGDHGSGTRELVREGTSGVVPVAPIFDPPERV